MRARPADIEAQLADAGRVERARPLVTATLMEVRLHLPGRGTRTFRPETIEIMWRQR